jgi:hypothetical protein
MNLYRNNITIGDIPQLDVVVPSFVRPGILKANYKLTGVTTTPTNETDWNALFTSFSDSREWTLPSNGVFWKSTDASTPTGANNPPAPIANTGANGLAYELEGYVYCPLDGTYSFILNSDDGGQIKINNVIKYFYYDGRVCTADYSTTLGTVIPVELTTGWHQINIRMNNGSGGYGEALGWKKPGDLSYSTIPYLYLGVI